MRLRAFGASRHRGDDRGSRACRAGAFGAATYRTSRYRFCRLCGSFENSYRGKGASRSIFCACESRSVLDPGTNSARGGIYRDRHMAGHAPIMHSKQFQRTSGAADEQKRAGSSWCVGHEKGAPMVRAIFVLLSVAFAHGCVGAEFFCDTGKVHAARPAASYLERWTT